MEHIVDDAAEIVTYKGPGRLVKFEAMSIKSWGSITPPGTYDLMYFLGYKGSFIGVDHVWWQFSTNQVCEGGNAFFVRVYT
jgi:hypothetical protein